MLIDSNNYFSVGNEIPDQDVYVECADKTWDDIRYLLTLKYGTPIDGGFTRIVFRTKTGVVKLDYPSCLGCNLREYSIGDWGNNIPLPNMKIFNWYGFELLFMEWVEQIPYDPDKILPAWVDYIDGQQVGYTKSGKLVPYDIL